MVVSTWIWVRRRRIFWRRASGAWSEPQERWTSFLTQRSRSYSSRQGAHSSRCWRISSVLASSSSLSMKTYTRCRISLQSTSWCSPQLTTPPRFRSRPPGAGPGRARSRPAGHAVAVGHLLVGKALDIGQVDGQPEVLRDRLQGLLDVGVGQVLEGDGLGRLQAAGGVRLGGGQLPV